MELHTGILALEICNQDVQEIKFIFNSIPSSRLFLGYLRPGLKWQNQKQTQENVGQEGHVDDLWTSHNKGRALECGIQTKKSS